MLDALTIAAEGDAAVGLGDDSQAVFAKALAGFRGVDGMGRQDAIPVDQGLIVAGFVLAADVAPIALSMAVQAGVQVLRGASLKCAGGSDDLSQREAGRVTSDFYTSRLVYSSLILRVDVKDKQNLIMPVLLKVHYMHVLCISCEISREDFTR